MEWKEIHQKMRDKAWDSYRDTGYMASYVGLNEQKEVSVKILSGKEILQLIELYDNIKDIPTEYTIYRDNEILNLIAE